MSDTKQPFYTHEGLDYPDPPYDPNPSRRYSAETLARMDAELERQKALIAVWRWMRGGSGAHHAGSVGRERRQICQR